MAHSARVRKIRHGRNSSGCGAPQHLSTVASLGTNLTGTAADPQASATAPSESGGISILLVVLIAIGGIAVGSGVALRFARRPPVGR